MIEQDIFQSDLDIADKEALLVTYAVGRNSLEFWFSLSQNAIDRPRLKSGNESSGNSFLDWWSQNVTPALTTIVNTDFAGAAAGFLDGAISSATGGTALMPVTGTIFGGVDAGHHQQYMVLW